MTTPPTEAALDVSDRAREAKINAIARELLSVGNEPSQVAGMAYAAKSLPVGTRVKHAVHSNIEGVIGSAITEGLQVAITTPDNLNGAFCFCDPRNLIRFERDLLGDRVQDDAVRVLLERLRDWKPKTGEDWPDHCGRLEPLIAAAIAALTTQPAPVEARFGDGYAATALVDLTNEITLNVGPDAPDVPNYADWQITLPAGHWRAIAEFVRSCASPVERDLLANRGNRRAAIKATLIDHGIDQISGALLDDLVKTVTLP